MMENHGKSVHYCGKSMDILLFRSRRVRKRWIVFVRERVSSVLDVQSLMLQLKLDVNGKLLTRLNRLTLSSK